MQKPKNKKVGVKFCGHCAPQMDMMDLLGFLHSQLPDIDFVFYVREPDPDILLVMHACDAQCAEIPEFDGPVIEVAPYQIDHWTYDPEGFYQILKDRLLAVTAS